MIRAKPTPDGKNTILKLYRDVVRRISNKQAAEELGTTSPERISRIFSGDEEPSKQQMKRCCEWMGADVGDIWTFDRSDVKAVEQEGEE